MNISNRTIGLITLPLVMTMTSGCNIKSDKQGGTQGKPLNVMIISGDDLNFNSLGAFGCTVEDITPNLDRFASGAIRFTNAHNNTAVCQPCRQSWLTGLYPHNNGAEGLEPIDEHITTLPGILNQAGYINGILGKEVHHQPTENFFWDFIPHKTEIDSTWRKGHSRTPDLFYEYSKRFFELSKEENKPFFFSVNSHDPHRPFAGSAIDSAAWGGNMPPISRIYHPEDIQMLGYLPDIPDVRKEVSQYYNTVYRMDQSIGSVLRALEESGLADNTLVIYTADHGAAFPFAKSQCYLNSTKAPLIIRWPGVTDPGNTTLDHIISGTDLMPTILEAIGLPVPENLDGRSFAPLLLEEAYEENAYVFTSYYQIFARIRFPMRCIQTKEFGYIYNFWSDGELEMRGDAMGGITWRAMVKAAESDPHIAERVELYRHRVKEEFYDFKNDPDGYNNLIDDPAYAGKIEEFREMMLEAMEKYDDPAYETYKNRKTPGVLDRFMEAQREKAKNTKPNVMF